MIVRRRHFRDRGPMSSSEFTPTATITGTETMRPFRGRRRKAGALRARWLLGEDDE